MTQMTDLLFQSIGNFKVLPPRIPFEFGCTNQNRKPLINSHTFVCEVNQLSNFGTELWAEKSCPIFI